MREKIVIGMSGGVDSSVAAYLLKEQGYEVVGVTMETWQEKEGIQSSAIEDAKSVADTLSIEHHVIDFKKEFRRDVVDYFISEYQNGRTPNPCIVCNRRVKWQALLTWANEHGSDYIATGHYARIVQLPNQRYCVVPALAGGKDQSYVLYNLTQEQLAHTKMPVGNYDKEQIRSMARSIGISVAEKGDSQDICFIPDHDYAQFIERQTGRKSIPGNFVDTNGQVLGQHKGLEYYTIGQRKGLGISAPTPLFVQKLRSETNEVVLCKSDELFTKTCVIRDVNYMAEAEISDRTQAKGKIRYSHQGDDCILSPIEDNRILCEFIQPQRAITPGQAAVFYQGEYILCGGIIE